jgi:hypothetical protein
MTVVTPRRVETQVKWPELWSGIDRGCKFMLLISLSKRIVMATPGIIERMIHSTSNLQNCTEKTVRSGLDGRKEVWTTSVCLSSAASSPLCGIQMKRMMEIAAVYSLSLKRNVTVGRGLHELVVERTTAKRKVPTAPITEYRNEAKGAAS